MTKFARMLDALDLYSPQVTTLNAEEVAARLQVSRPTAFRYLRELSEAGFLAKWGSRYSLGARLITLDYRIRASDPVLRAAADVMRSLCDETACGAILCRIYNETIVHVHYEAGYEEAPQSFYGRGRELPLFRGAASKVMLAFLAASKLRRIYEAHQQDPDVRKIASDWHAFRAYYAAIRKTGHYLSQEEVDHGTVGLAAPIHIPKMGILGVVSLVFSESRLELINVDGLALLLKQRMADLSRQLGPVVTNSP